MHAPARLHHPGAQQIGRVVAVDGVGGEFEGGARRRERRGAPSQEGVHVGREQRIGFGLGRADVFAGQLDRERAVEIDDRAGVRSGGQHRAEPARAGARRVERFEAERRRPARRIRPLRSGALALAALEADELHSPPDARLRSFSAAGRQSARSSRGQHRSSAARGWPMNLPAAEYHGGSMRSSLDWKTLGGIVALLVTFLLALPGVKAVRAEGPRAPIASNDGPQCNAASPELEIAQAGATIAQLQAADRRSDRRSGRPRRGCAHPSRQPRLQLRVRARSGPDHGRRPAPPRPAIARHRGLLTRPAHPP